MKRPSQNDRILAVLQDGREHEMRDIHRIAGFCRLNSRISELRKRGHVIECRREGQSYYYRLVKPEPANLREYPPELVHGELCSTRFGANAACDCGKEPVLACTVDESAGVSGQLALSDSAAAHIYRDIAGTPYA